MSEQASRRLQPIDPKRQRHLCRLEAEREVTALVRDVSGRGAFVATAYRPPLGAKVRLHHPIAGAVDGRVAAHHGAGVGIAFDVSPRATGFALAMIAGGVA